MRHGSALFVFAALLAACLSLGPQVVADANPKAESVEAKATGPVANGLDTQPNVLVVTTDDQPYGSVSKMPFLRENARQFTSFSQAFTNNSLCCPARATNLTGDYDHHTGVDTLDGSVFDPGYTLATEFDAAGYETGLFGKYLNGYPFGQGSAYIPPGWDRWAAFVNRDAAAEPVSTRELEAEGAAYYNYELTVDGLPRYYGSDPEDYSTDVLAGFTWRFIRDSEGPFFAMYQPYGPHANYIPAPRHRRLFSDAEVPLVPKVNRRSEGTEQWWTELPPQDPERLRSATRQQWRTLRSEDEALRRMFTLLKRQGELDETIVVFMSDNGYSLGAHRWVKKRCLYDSCAQIPLMIKAPGPTEPRSKALVSNVDIAPTIADLAGVDLEADGESLAPIMRGEQLTLSRPVLMHVNREFEGDLENGPEAWGLRTGRWKYIEYPGGGSIDLFDLTEDPYELVDVSEQHPTVVDRLAQKLDEIRAG